MKHARAHRALRHTLIGPDAGENLKRPPPLNTEKLSPTEPRERGGLEKMGHFGKITVKQAGIFAGRTGKSIDR
jgi:hypothetical protein